MRDIVYSYSPDVATANSLMRRETASCCSVLSFQRLIEEFVIAFFLFDKSQIGSENSRHAHQNSYTKILYPHISLTCHILKSLHWLKVNERT